MDDDEGNATDGSRNDRSKKRKTDNKALGNRRKYGRKRVHFDI